MIFDDCFDSSSQTYKLTRAKESDILFENNSEDNEEELKVHLSHPKSIEEDLSAEKEQLPSRFLLSRATHKNILSKSKILSKANEKSEDSLNMTNEPSKKLCKVDYGTEIDTIEPSLEISHVSNISKYIVILGIRHENRKIQSKVIVINKMPKSENINSFSKDQLFKKESMASYFTMKMKNRFKKLDNILKQMYIDEINYHEHKIRAIPYGMSNERAKLHNKWLTSTINGGLLI